MSESDWNIITGAALGDALGAGVEGGRALARALKEDPEGVGRRFFPYSPFGFRPGDVTDDTQMTWAALVELDRGRPDVTSAAGRREYLERVGGAYRAWFRRGPPDVGAATAAALRSDGWTSWAGGDSAGNGSLMRATATYVAGYRGEALRIAAVLDSTLTHPDPRCVAACLWYAATLEAGGDLRRGLEALTMDVGWLDRPELPWPWEAGAGRVKAVVEGALAGEHVDCLSTSPAEWPTGYVLSSLGQAAWAATQVDGLRLAVLHGGRDADTIGAIAGGLIGARGGAPDERLLAELRLDGLSFLELLRERSGRGRTGTPPGRRRPPC